MSVTGKGCEKCNYTGRKEVSYTETVRRLYTGRVAWIGAALDNPLEMKPCDHCGGLSQFVPPPDYRALCVELVAALERQKRFHDPKCQNVCWCGAEPNNAAIDTAIAKAARVLGEDLLAGKKEGA